MKRRQNTFDLTELKNNSELRTDSVMIQTMSNETLCEQIKEHEDLKKEFLTGLDMVSHSDRYWKSDFENHSKQSFKESNLKDGIASIDPLVIEMLDRIEELADQIAKPQQYYKDDFEKKPKK